MYWLMIAVKGENMLFYFVHLVLFLNTDALHAVKVVPHMLSSPFFTPFLEWQLVSQWEAQGAVVWMVVVVKERILLGISLLHECFYILQVA